jgi:hypothetical protein
VTTNLASKVDKVTGKVLSTNDYTTAEKIKLAAITGTNTGDQDLSTYATNTSLALKANVSDVNTGLATKVDKVTGKVLSTNDYTTAEKTKLAAITGTNTGDQDLSSFASNTALALKANTTDVTTNLATKVDKLTGKNLSTNDYSTAEKTKLAAITGANTGDQDLSSYATNTSLTLKANTSDVTTNLATKVDKVTGKNLSTNDYSTAEKTKLAAITGTNTGDQDLSTYATITALSLKANASDVNTSLGLKASVTDVTTSLALKEDATNKSAAADLGGVAPSDVLFPTQKAVKEYVAANAGSGGVADAGITNIKLADGAVTYAKFQSIPTNTILGNTSSSTTSVQAIATTGSDNVVLSTSPTITSPIFITPNIGVATATSINDVIINGFNFKFDLPSLTITGTTTLQGNNTGDDATNSKYEGLLTSGAVDLITNQAIDGKKTFLNDITMANLLGVGSITPTTINFANGSKIGDIYNINNKNPDADGSIDLYAPYGAKWVELNYADSNYIYVQKDAARIDIGNKYWEFKKDGSSWFPGNLVIGTDLTDTVKISSPTNLNIQVRNDDSENDFWNWKFNKYGNTILPGNLTFEEDNNPEIISDYSLNIESKDDLRVKHRNNDFFTSLKLVDGFASLGIGNADGTVIKFWDYKIDGSSWFPGALNFTDNHAINFTSTGTSTPTTNASITSEGGYLKLGTRAATDEELNEDGYNGIELNYADLSWLSVDYGGVSFHTIDDQNANNWSGVNFDFDKFSFYKLNNGTQYDWIFNGLDASTNLPGALLLTGNIETAGTLKLGSTTFTNQSGANGYVLTYNNNNAVWQASTGTGVSDNIDANTLSGTTLKSTITGSSLTSVGTLSNLTVTNTIEGSITGNAATATTATTAGNITATSNNTLTTLSSLTSVGILNSATINGKVIVGASSEVSVSAVLEASSTTQGFLPPRMTIEQRSVIASPAQGLMIYCTNCGTYGQPQYYNGTAWLNFAGNASAKAIPTVTPTIGTYTYTGSAQGPSEATNTGTGTTYTYSYSGTVSTTYSSSATKPIEVGDYAVIASVSADGNYEAASSSATAFRILNILSVGDDYQGGKIAYFLVDGDPGYDATTPHGLIAASSDQGTGIQWYNGSYTSTGATGTNIGTGLSNTNTIITSQGPTSTDYAAGLARAYTGGGFTDWYLPSINELGKLYLNRVSIGGFASNANTNYWSSTEESVFFSFYFDFSNGVPTYNLKNDSYRIRAVRSF